jgi:cytidylate kinase
MNPASDRPASLRIAIDGPAGSGKSTLARNLAQALDCLYVDTGAMYRAVAYRALAAGLDVNTEAGRAQIAALAAQLEFHFEWQGGEVKLYVDGEDVTQVIRTPQVERLSSPVSAIPRVREELVAAQRALAQLPAIVMEGRDIGTVVMPDADVKIYLTASAEERARRRWRQLRAHGLSRPYETVLAETLERDQRDSTRPISPLRPAPDAIVLDTTHLSQREVLEEALRLIEQVRLRRSTSAKG